MSLMCLFGFHSRSLASVARRGSQETSLCEHCARPLVKSNGRWIAAEPVYIPPHGQAR